MRITYRHQKVKSYWEKRWSSIPVDVPMSNRDIYPLKYAEQAIVGKDGAILEAGCGTGRLLRYYHDRGYDITGIDYIAVAIDKLKTADSSLKVEVADITSLRFKNSSFHYVLAFGLYHNLEHGLEQAIAETFRITTPGGVLCASFRADNLQTRINDWLTERRQKQETAKVFHKMNLTKRELMTLFERAGYRVRTVSPVENMPVLYKLSFFRARSHKVFNENLARAEGYKLSLFGSFLQRIMMTLFPGQLCNVFVLIAEKPINTED